MRLCILKKLTLTLTDNRLWKLMFFMCAVEKKGHNSNTNSVLKTSQLTTEFVATGTKRIPVGIHVLFKIGVFSANCACGVERMLRRCTPHTRTAARCGCSWRQHLLLLLATAAQSFCDNARWWHLHKKRLIQAFFCCLPCSVRSVCCRRRHRRMWAAATATTKTTLWTCLATFWNSSVLMVTAVMKREIFKWRNAGSDDNLSRPHCLLAHRWCRLMFVIAGGCNNCATMKYPRSHWHQVRMRFAIRCSGLGSGLSDSKSMPSFKASICPLL